MGWRGSSGPLNLWGRLPTCGGLAIRLVVMQRILALRLFNRLVDHHRLSSIRHFVQFIMPISVVSQKGVGGNFGGLYGCCLWQTAVELRTVAVRGGSHG